MDVIATRELEPYGWCCVYQIVGLDDDRVYSIVGVDSIQAIILALKMIGSKLVNSREAKQGKLLWDGSSDFQFPLPAVDGGSWPSTVIADRQTPPSGSSA